jgi:5-oxopent-3-ene-1,2,5-tricarboxylate decarboxylase / 2-hydroxyhepta-2,4-diene-1,7-dioate isomerase
MRNVGRANRQCVSDDVAVPASDPITLTDELKAKLNAVSTATLTGQLQNRGIRSTFLSGLRPIKEGQRMVGIAHTLRYVPMREDLRSTLLAGQNAQRRAIESLQSDEVLVIEARGEPDAGTIGDIFAMRALQLGAAGVITDGALRDTPAIRRLDIPVYHGSSHAATLSRLHIPLDHQIPIACAGVTVMPGDVIVGDEEGAVVIPAALVEEVAADAYQQELEEEWAFEVVAGGDSTIGAFPVSDKRRPEFDAWRASREQKEEA